MCHIYGKFHGKERGSEYKLQIKYAFSFWEAIFSPRLGFLGFYRFQVKENVGHFVVSILSDLHHYPNSIVWQITKRSSFLKTFL